MSKGGINNVGTTAVIFGDNVDFTGASPATAQVLSDGQLLIGSSVTPKIRVNTLTAGAGIAIANGNGTITIAATGAGFLWLNQVGSFTAAKETGNFILAALTASLPATPSRGDTIAFIVDTTSALTIQATGGYTIRLGNTVSAGNGTAVSTQKGDSIELVFSDSDTSWIALSSNGNWTIA